MSAFKNAKWIWLSDSTPDQYGEFLAKFKDSDSAKINISCDGDYTLYLNGKFVSSNQYGDYEHYKIYDTIDLSPYMINGENTLAILVWHIGKDFSRYKKYDGGLIFEVFDDEKVILSSDMDVLSRQSRAYKSGLCKEISPQLGFSYQYDNTKEDNWIKGDLIDFEKSKEVVKNCTFFKRPVQKSRLLSFADAKCVFSQEKTNFVCDLGKETVGLLSFDISANDDTSINISYGEHLDNGHVRRKIGDRDFSIDYVAKAGANNYTNCMLRFACRYIEITADKPITVNKIGLIPQAYFVVRNKVNLASEQDKKIYDICVNTLELCMMEHYVDCPWREQCLYAFDSRNQMLCGYYAFKGGNYDYARSNLLLMSKDKRADGLLSICYPCGIDLTIPSFSLYYLVSVLEYVKHSKDTSIIDEVNSKLIEILNTFEKNANGGLVKMFEGDNHWNFYDWSPFLSGSIGNSDEPIQHAVINLLTIIALKSYKEICEICNLDFMYDELLNRLSHLAKKTFFDENKRVFIDTKETRNELELVNALGILSGIAKEHNKIVAEKLKNQELISCSLSMKCFVYDALINVDKAKYKDFILNDIRATYQKMIDFGSTTVWETKDGRDDFEGAGSLCHGWSSIPVYYYSILK